MNYKPKVVEEVYGDLAVEDLDKRLEELRGSLGCEVAYKATAPTYDKIGRLKIGEIITTSEPLK